MQAVAKGSVEGGGGGVRNITGKQNRHLIKT